MAKENTNTKKSKDLKKIDRFLKNNKKEERKDKRLYNCSWPAVFIFLTGCKKDNWNKKK